MTSVMMARQIILTESEDGIEAPVDEADDEADAEADAEEAGEYVGRNMGVYLSLIVPTKITRVVI